MEPTLDSTCQISNSLLKRAIMASTNGVMIVKVVKKQLRIVFVNTAYQRITGYSAEEVIGSAPGMLHRDDKDQSALILLRQAIREQEPITVILKNWRKDGTVFWNELTISPLKDDTGRLTHFLGIVNDVTAQKNAEKERASWAERLNTITTMSTDGLISFDSDGYLSYANNTFQSLLGLREVDLKGIGIDAFDELIAARCDPAQPHLGVAKIINIMPQANDGSACLEEIHCSEIHLMLPKARVLIQKIRKTSRNETLVYLTDITSQRLLEEMKSNFLATAAHELRTPITSILGYSELLMMKNYDVTTSRSFLEIILRQARQVSVIVNEILDLARIEARQGKDFIFNTIDLRKVIDRVVATFVDSTERIVVEGMGDAFLVNVDEEKIHQVLCNLISNALKFSPAKTPVSISICHQSDKTPSMIGVAIADQGIGMTEEQLARLGERFFCVETSGGVPGVGLGIALCKEVINLHSGSLEVCSKFGKGSCFTVWLPSVVVSDSEIISK